MSVQHHAERDEYAKLNRVSRFVEVLIGGRHALECGGLAPLWISNWPNRKRKRCQATALQNAYVCPAGRLRSCAATVFQANLSHPAETVSEWRTVT